VFAGAQCFAWEKRTGRINTKKVEIKIKRKEESLGRKRIALGTEELKGTLLGPPPHHPPHPTSPRPVVNVPSKPEGSWTLEERDEERETVAGEVFTLHRVRLRARAHLDRFSCAELRQPSVFRLAPQDPSSMKI